MSKRTTRIGAWIVTLCMILTLFPALPAYAAEVEEVAEESAQAIAPAAEEADAAEEVAEVAEVEETAPAEEPVAAEEAAEAAPTEEAAEPVAVAPAEESVAANAAEDTEEVAEVAEPEATDAELLAANQKITVATLDQLIEAMNNEVQYIQLQNEAHQLVLTKPLPDIKVTDFRMEIDLATCELIVDKSLDVKNPVFNVVNGGRLLLTADKQTGGTDPDRQGQIFRNDGKEFIAARADGEGSTLEIEYKALVTDGHVEALGGSKVEIRGEAEINNAKGTAVIVNGGDVTVTGNAAIYGAVGGNGSDPVNGGGVRVESGSLTLTGSATISGNAGIAYVKNSKTNAWDAVKDTGYGGGVYVANGAKFTMSGGSVANSWANNNGGGVYVANGGTFTMSGGSIIQNTAAKDGGGVYPAKGSTMTLSGGKIGGSAANANSAGGNGGGIYADGSLTVKGGEVSFNQTTSATATFPANNVYVVTGTKVSVPGKLASGTKVYFIVPEYEARTSKRVTFFSADYEAYGNGNGKSDGDYYKISKFFYPDNPECAIGVYNKDRKELANADVAEGEVGEIAIAMNQWVHLQDMIFYALKGNESNPNVGVQQDIYAQATDKALVIGDPYALDASYTQDYKSYWQERHPDVTGKTYGSQSRKEITLDMHGYRLDRNLSDSAAVKDGFVIRVAPGYKLTITNDKEVVGVITGGNNRGNGGGIILEKAVASVGSGDPGTSGGVLNLITVEVKGNKAVGYTEAKVYYPGNGGGVYVADGAQFSMEEDAQISANTADDNGGGVYIDTNGAFTMKNNLTADGPDAIRENTALGKTANSGNGGGVYVSANGTFTMGGGTVGSNKAVKEHKNSTGNGGGVYVSAGGNFTMSGGSALKANTADTDGGGVYLNGGKLTLNSASMKISGNTAKRNGGGVCLSGAGTLNMTNGAIDGGNSATLGGGVYVAPGATATVSGGNVKDNKATNGAGVYLDQRTTPAPAIGGMLTLSGGAFSGNVATGDGGGVYMTTNAAFNMTGGKISDGNKAANGGGVYVASGKNYSFTMGGGEIRNNEATKNGGGVYAGSSIQVSGVSVVTGSKKDGKPNNVYLPEIAKDSAAYGTKGDKLTTVGTVQHIDASGIQAASADGKTKTSIGVTIGSTNVVTDMGGKIVTFTDGFFSKAVDDASYKADTLFDHKTGDIPLFTYDEYDNKLVAVTVPTGDASLEAAFVGVYNEATQTYERHTDHVDNPNQTWRAKPIILTEKKVPLYYIKDNVLHEGYYYLYDGDLNLSAALGINANEDVRLCLDKKNLILNTGFTGITVNNNAQFWLVDELKDADGNPAYALDDSGKIQGGKITPANPKNFSLTGNLVTLNSATFYMVGGAITELTSQTSLVTVNEGSTFDMSGGAIALNKMKGAAVEVNATNKGAFKIHGYAQIINNESTKSDPNVVPKGAVAASDYYYGGVYVKGNGGAGDLSNFWLFDNVLIYGNTNNEGAADANNDGSTVIPRNVFLDVGATGKVATIYIYAKMWVNEDDNRKTAVGVACPVDTTKADFGLSSLDTDSEGGFTFTSGYGRRNDASLDRDKIQDTMYRKHFQSEIKDVVVSSTEKAKGTDAELRLLKHEHNWESRIYKEGDINVIYTYCREKDGACEYYWDGTAPANGSLLDKIFMAMKLQYRDYVDGAWTEWQDAKDTLTLHTNDLDNAFRMVALEEHEDFRDVINDTGTHWADLLLRYCKKGDNPIASGSWLAVSVTGKTADEAKLIEGAKLSSNPADGEYIAIALPRYAKAGEEKYSVTQLEFPFTINTKGSYDVTFDMNGATSAAIAAQTVEEGGKATKPADPTKDGFTFAGWNLGDAAYDFNSAVTKAITLKAQWKEIPPAPATPGDFTGPNGTPDGEVGFDDVDVLLDMLDKSNAGELTADQEKAYDVDGDGAFTMADIFAALDLADQAGLSGETESAELLSISGNTALKKTVNSFVSRLNFSRADELADLQAAGAVVTVGSVSGKPGDTVTVPVTISSNPGFTGFTFDIVGAEGLQLTGITQGEALSGGTFTPYLQTNRVSWMDRNGKATANGEILRLEFKISDTAASGQYAVSIGPRDGNEKNFVDRTTAVSATYKAGGVTVRAGGDAEQIPTVTVGEIAGQPGSSVKLPVSIASNPGFTAMMFDLAYDDAALKLTGFEPGDVLNNATGGTNAPDYKMVSANRVRWYGMRNTASGDGDLMTLTFEILSGAKAGDYSVALSLANNSTTNFQNTAGKIPEFVAGKVTVEAKTLTVNWLNGDGSVLDSKTYKEGEAEPKTDKTPAKAPDADNTYTFSGWDNGTVDGNTKTYKPEFTAVPKTVYTVIWLDGDGTQLDSKTYKEGEVLPTTDKVPTKAADEQNTYTFAQWDGGTVDGNVTTYKPEFIATAILKVIWLDGDGSQLDSKTYAQGEAVPTTDKVPTKVADAQNTYVFKEWTLTADGAVRTYAPEFTAVPISAPVYTVIWLDGDDSELDRKTYHEGEPVPATDKIPTKAPDAENTYVFNEWKLQSEVGNDRTYKPEFTAVPIGSSDRTVIWLNGDGTTLDSKTYQEGEAEPTTDKIPVKAEDDQNTYVFSKWDSGTVDGAVKTYKPDFTAVPKASSARTVIWLNGDGSQLDSKTYQEGEAEPTTDKTPTKTENGVALTFTGWDGGTVNGNVKTYAPQFAQPGASYTVTVEDGGTGSGTYKPGDTVYITAAPEKDNRIFADWTWSGPEGFVIPDSLSNLTSFTMPEGNVTVTPNYQGGCYVATAVYGSYDCPEVWTLRRFRDTVLAKTWYGRLFIRLYYAVSPTAVKLFGDCGWFQNFWRGRLDSMVSNLQESGFESTPYQDKAW